MSEPHERLDAAMAQRRLDLGLKTWRDLAQAADISYETLRALRKGEGTPAEATIHGLERALKWRSGSIAAVYDNRDPEPLPGGPAAEKVGDDPLGFDLDSYVPQSAMELVIKQMFQAQRAEREELQRKLREIDEKLDRLAGHSGDDDGEARTA